MKPAGHNASVRSTACHQVLASICSTCHFAEKSCILLRWLHEVRGRFRHISHEKYSDCNNDAVAPTI